MLNTIYDYRENVLNDLVSYIKEGIEYKSFNANDLDFETIYESAWTADSVTGNASGSYTFNRYKAEEKFIA